MTAEQLMDLLRKTLSGKASVPVPFPPCADVMLSRHRDLNEDIDKFFFEYFMVGSHQIFKDPVAMGTHTTLADFLGCLTRRGSAGFPPESCLPGSCITLGGNRGTSHLPDKPQTLSRLFVGDLVWLFFMERMGVFKMLGAILDDFVTKGKYRLPNGDLHALIMEAMVRQTQTGLSSTVRARDGSYRKVLSWTSDVGRKLGSEARLNTGFNVHFHKFIGLALTWYSDRRLAHAIQTTNTMRKSVATLVAISKTLVDLKNTFHEFDFGRSYTHTLSGIVWCVSGLKLIRDLRDPLGISSLSSPAEYIPAAYDLLVKGVAAGATDSSHYSQNLECASSGRDILIDLEVLDVSDIREAQLPVDPTQPDPRGALTLWLDLVEGKIESYRTAYQGLTGVDLGAPGTPVIEQQA